jgi:hypothetical protein
VTTITVTVEQVEFAQALVEIAGGLDKVDPLIARIAIAPPKPREDASDQAS